MSTAETQARPATEPLASGWLVDRLNPILVREVQQALRGKMFVGSLWISILGIVVFALWVASQGQSVAGQGAEYFAICLSFMTPVLLFVVPIQAFVSMRNELQPGSAEQLFLSRLRPGQIVRGKLMAAMVQYLVYVSVFGPLLSTLYMVQGLDLPTIALALVFSALFCLSATVTAIAAASLARWSIVQSLAYAGVAFGLGSASLGMMGATYPLVAEMGWLMRQPMFWTILQTIFIVTGFGVWLLGMVAASQLTHEHENRSTRFRVFAWVLVPCAFGWLYYIAPAMALPYVFPAVGMGACVLAGTFGWFAVTEARALSPRARAHVPKGALASWLSIPWLPGGGRGMVFFLGLVAFAVSVGYFGSKAWFGGVEDRVILTMGIAVCYIVILVGLTCVFRRMSSDRKLGTFVARALPPGFVILGCLLPVAWDLVTDGATRRWHIGHVSNPFWTLDATLRDPMKQQHVLLLVGCVALGVVGLTIPAMWEGAAEVLRASRARRALDADTAAEGRSPAGDSGTVASPE